MLYKRKLSKVSVYNMTGHLSTKRKALCVVWHEGQAGRSGNDIASAVYRMLQEVEKICPEIDTLTIWSDSCIPQNKNSIMATATTHFLLNHTKITTVEEVCRARPFC